MFGFRVDDQLLSNVDDSEHAVECELTEPVIPSTMSTRLQAFGELRIFKPLLNALKLAKLQKERSQVSKDYEAERKRLVVSGLPEEEASSQAAQMHKGDFRVTHTNIVVFLSDRLVEEAERLWVPVPEDEKYWIRLKYAPHLHLSEEGQAALRKLIREEKKGRREAISFWFNIITVILSLLVAIFAVYKS